MNEAEFDIKEILSLLQRRFKLLLSTVAVVFAISGIVLLSLTPRYTASTLILVDPGLRNQLDQDSQQAVSNADNARVDSEVEIIKSPAVMLRVVESQNLISDPEFGARIGAMERLALYFGLDTSKLASGDDKSETPIQSVLNLLSSRTSVSRTGLTYLITVSVESVSPARAAALANAVAQAYVQSQIESKLQSAGNIRDALQQRLDLASKNISDVEGQIDGYISNSIDHLTGGPGQNGLTDMRNQLEQLKKAKLENTALVSSLQSALGAGDFNAISGKLASDALKTLQRQRDDITRQIGRQMDGSQKAIDLKAQLDQVTEQLNQAANSEISKLQATITDSGERESRLRESIRQTALSSGLPNDVLQRIYELQQNADQSRATYQTVLARLKRVDAQSFIQIADSRVVSVALPPSQPSFPKTNIILLLTGVVAVGLGFGLAFLYENFIGGIVSQEQLSAIVKRPGVSAVPHVANARGERKDVTDELIHQPLSIYSESIRRIRLAMERQVRGQKIKGSFVGLVTSSVPEEGKTTTALSVARSFAMTGRRTLLIDCDLRHPSLHNCLGVRPKADLLDFLAGPIEESSLREMVYVEPATNLHAILGQRTSPVPTDSLLDSERFRQLISLAKQRFDVVILDSPPVLPIVDTQYLARVADVICMVVRWARTSQGQLRASFRDIQEASPDNGNNVVLALTQVEARSGTYYSSYTYGGKSYFS